MLRVAGVASESFVDGEGVRYAIFFQGCKHNCDGCHNKSTHDFNSGYELNIDAIIDDLQALDYLDGVTFSGGDPLFQAEEIIELAKRIKEETDLNIWCYTGFVYEDIMANDDAKKELLTYIDVLVDGRYDKSNRSLALKFRGSSNQRLINVKESLVKNLVVLLELE